MHPLKRYRKINHMKQEALANMLGVHVSTISRIEAGLQKISAESAKNWEDKLKKQVSKEELVWPELYG